MIRIESCESVGVPGLMELVVEVFQGKERIRYLHNCNASATCSEHSDLELLVAP